ncbi:MAG: hypothetical protein H2069_02350 [Legionella sp.]|nr:hypothetical protein [Legionella sp.]
MCQEKKDLFLAAKDTVTSNNNDISYPNKTHLSDNNADIGKNIMGKSIKPLTLFDHYFANFEDIENQRTFIDGEIEFFPTRFGDKPLLLLLEDPINLEAYNEWKEAINSDQACSYFFNKIISKDEKGIKILLNLIESDIPLFEFKEITNKHEIENIINILFKKIGTAPNCVVAFKVSVEMIFNYFKNYYSTKEFKLFSTLLFSALEECSNAINKEIENQKKSQKNKWEKCRASLRLIKNLQNDLYPHQNQAIKEKSNITYDEFMRAIDEENENNVFEILNKKKENRDIIISQLIDNNKFNVIQKVVETICFKFSGQKGFAMALWEALIPNIKKEPQFFYNLMINIIKSAKNTKQEDKNKPEKFFTKIGELKKFHETHLAIYAPNDDYVKEPYELFMRAVKNCEENLWKIWRPNKKIISLYLIAECSKDFKRVEEVAKILCLKTVGKKLLVKAFWEALIPATKINPDSFYELIKNILQTTICDFENKQDEIDYKVKMANLESFQELNVSMNLNNKKYPLISDENEDEQKKNLKLF